jgi:dihydrofolate reductase
MIVSLIVAHGPKNEIGFQNKLLWHLSDDLKNFKKVTTGKAIVMGRKTFESIGKPLPNRKNIVLSRDPHFNPEGVDVIHDPLMAFDLALEFNDSDDSELIICGGEEIYKIYLPFAQKIYRTLVADFKGEADAFFPQLDEQEWTITDEEKFEQFSFQTLLRSR